MLTKVEPHAAPHSAKVFFADAALDKQRCHGFSEVERIFSAQRRGVETALVSMADAELEIVGQVIRDVDLIEETRMNVVSGIAADRC